MTQFILRRRRLAFVVAGLALGAGLLSSSIAAQGVTNSGPYSLTRNVHLADLATAHVYDPSLNRLYSSSTRGIFQTDLTTMNVLSRTPEVRGAGSLSLDAARGELYVLSLHDDAMRVVDVSSGKVTRTFKAPAWFNVVYEPTKGELYYLRGDSKEVQVADRIDGRTISSIALAGQPSSLIGDAARHRLIVRLADKPLIQVIDTTDHTVTASWPARQDGISALAINAEGTRVFTSAGRDIVMLDGLTGKELSRCSTGEEATSLVFDAAAGYVVALGDGSRLNVAKVDGDTLKMVQSLDMRAHVTDLFLNPKTHTVLGIGRRVDEDAFAMTRSPAQLGGGATLLTLTLKQ